MWCRVNDAGVHIQRMASIYAWHHFVRFGPANAGRKKETNNLPMTALLPPDATLRHPPTLSICLTLSHSRSELPDRSRESIVIRNGVVDIKERSHDGGTSLRVIAWLQKLNVNGSTNIDFDRNVSWQIELRVERASAVAGHD